MRILQVSTYDRGGGAGMAAHRLHRGFLSLGHDARCLVGAVRGPDTGLVGPGYFLGRIFNRLRRGIDKLPLWSYPSRVRPFSTGWFPNFRAEEINRLKPDIVHLHWVADGFLPVRALSRIHSPLVWTLHDQWPFTGGCFYVPDGCAGFKDSCGSCPALNSGRENDLSRRLLGQKRHGWRDVDLTVVAPSRWMAGTAGESSTFRGKPVVRIANGLNLEKYPVHTKEAARKRLGLDLADRIILAGAMQFDSDPRKGHDLFTRAMSVLQGKGLEKIRLLTFGSTAPGNSSLEGFPVRNLGTVHDEEFLSLAYRAADVFVLPSRVENLPYTLMEALACGTPGVAFAVGGIPDLVKHRRNGYLAGPFSAAGLAEGIEWVFKEQQNPAFFGREQVEDFRKEISIDVVCNEHLTLYREILKRHHEK